MFFKLKIYINCTKDLIKCGYHGVKYTTVKTVSVILFVQSGSHNYHNYAQCSTKISEIVLVGGLFKNSSKVLF